MIRRIRSWLRRSSPLEQRLGYRFRDPGLLALARTHSSARGKDGPCNERLEFLGDAVVGYVVSRELFRLFPDRDEGDLTVMKSAVVSRASMAGAAQRLGLDASLIRARGLGAGDLPASVLANAYEALVGAVCLDRGVTRARAFVLRTLKDDIAQARRDAPECRNHKSIPQQFTQAVMCRVPRYQVLKRGGPQHERIYTVRASVPDGDEGEGTGRTIKEAEQQAAAAVLAILMERRGASSPEELLTAVRNGKA